MENVVFLEAYTTASSYKETSTIHIPIESFITYCIYKHCSPAEVSLRLVSVNDTEDGTSIVLEDEVHFVKDEVPWQVASCVYPVVMFQDTIITGLCAVARHICAHRSGHQNSLEHEEGLLGFRKSCLQAPNTVSIWTKFCEVDIIKTVKHILETDKLEEVPVNLVRFENHLKKPVKVHNVYKIVRDMKKESLKAAYESKDETNSNVKPDGEKPREAKNRKWKSNCKKRLEVDCSVKIEDLNISHQFAEGPFITLADLILLPTYHILIQAFGNTFETLLPLTHKWYQNIMNTLRENTLIDLLNKFPSKRLSVENVILPTTEDVSLYKSDPKRHNPKKRLFTKEDDIENALSSLSEGMEMNITKAEISHTINWDNIPDGAKPSGGYLPDKRVVRKTQQLENLALVVMNVAKEGDLIVDFCSGSGHLGILVAMLLPKCTVILLENKEQSLLRARERVHKMGVKNILFYQCNLDFFIGKFDIGIALHACGVASDLVLDKCLKANAKFVICPCCYGSLHVIDDLVYPRSSKFSSLTVEQYMCIGHAADQTHEDHPLTERGMRCMAAIDSDRARLAQEFDYEVTLSKLNFLSCTPKNNLLIGVPS
ncbi:Glutathione S-transferase C-terminal domain-containing protein-like protein [Operophtera brumata]|uniref:Glutathione S-transferase C-terminal domain-containing protein-like protein n=1 Tax=Operophtera brumata TaxID=104452 RepID=A0A0L7LQ63_OPEBR|nr:Glutathione S-transferase C-terminal domain-containing protein-like protein [Operophtera brumata]